MKDDPFWKSLLFIAVLVFSVVTLYPSWVIKVLSYGKQTSQNINGGLLAAVRIIAAVAAIWSAVYLVWGLIRK